MTATTPQKNKPSFRDSLTVEIANGAAVSDAARIYGHTLLGIIMPAAWTAAGLTFQGSADGTNFYDVYDSTGTEKAIASVGASRIILVPPYDWFGLEWIKIRSGTTGTPVNQGALRSMGLIVGG